MRENIEWLIEQYTDKLGKLEREAREQSLGITYITGAIRAYSEVVEDLQGILDDSEEKECTKKI